MSKTPAPKKSEDQPSAEWIRSYQERRAREKAARESREGKAAKVAEKSPGISTVGGTVGAVGETAIATKAETTAASKPPSRAIEFRWQIEQLWTPNRHHTRMPVTLYDDDARDFWNLPGPAFKMLMALWFFRNKREGIARPGLERLMRRICGSGYIRGDKASESKRRALMRALELLKARGFVLQLTRGAPERAVEFFLAKNAAQVQAIREYYTPTMEPKKRAFKRVTLDTTH